MAANIHEPCILLGVTSSDSTVPNHGSTNRHKSLGSKSSSGMSASSEDTADSGFYQLNPDNICQETRSLSPRPSPRAIRRLSNMTETTDAEDIDFFLKVVSEFREYVFEKIEELEEQHKANESQLKRMQNLLKASEDAWTASEINLTKEINVLVNLLQKQQGIYMEQIKKHRSKEIDSLREKMDICRRNMKLISGVIGFAKKVGKEKDEAIREQTLKELKQRFIMASEKNPPEISQHGGKIDFMEKQNLNEIKRFLEESISGLPNPQRIVINSLPSNKPPTILAQSSPDDVTKNSIIVRWTDDDVSDDVTYEIFWKSPRDAATKSVSGVTESQFVIENLDANTDVTVQVQRHSANNASDLSSQAFYKTKPQPARFHLDCDTAHAKLQLSPDLFSVHYPGDIKSNVQKSPSRFTFALNVLGSISFFTGRHYWEVLVNSEGWALGVAYRSVPRNSWLGSNESSWILHHNPSKREYKVRHAGESVDVCIRRKRTTDELARVGIFVDYEGGIISFVDCYHMDVLHTYRTNGFSEPITAAVNPFYHGGVLTMITGLDVPDINFDN